MDVVGPSNHLFSWAAFVTRLGQIGYSARLKGTTHNDDILVCIHDGHYRVASVVHHANGQILSILPHLICSSWETSNS
jgi:hypothetical protein